MLHRNEDGKLPHVSWPGGYPVLYYCGDWQALCPACANGANGSEASEDPGTDTQWRLVACDVYWEGPVLQCAHCDADLESAYGDPDGGK